MTVNIADWSIARPGTSVNISMPRATIAFRLVDFVTGAQIADFTGANALAWPGVFANLTAAEKTVVRNAIEAALQRIAVERFA